MQNFSHWSLICSSFAHKEMFWILHLCFIASGHDVYLNLLCWDTINFYVVLDFLLLLVFILYLELYTSAAYMDQRAWIKFQT